MGILDDAIREHLELKRSHGATEDELRLKEAEVFGQPRQEAAPEAPLEEHTQLISPDDHLEPAPEDPYAVHPGDELVPDPEAAAAPAPAPADLEPLEPAPEDPYVVHPGDALVPDPDVPPPAPDHGHDEQHPALVDHDHIGGEEHAPEPVFGHAAGAPTAPPEAPLEPSPLEDPPIGDPPVEHPEIDEPPAEQASADDEEEDVLEETPEFLQDAPEHDRLWFEQKPPRDFDFGE